METIGFGFLLGIGIILAVLAFCAVVGVFVLFGLFVSYVANKGRKNAETAVQDVNFE